MDHVVKIYCCLD